MLPAAAVRDVVKTPVGELTLVASPEGLHFVGWVAGPLAELPLRPDAPILRAAKQQLGEYFAGERRTFDVPLAPQGTPFQLRAWRELSKIPYGETISYGEQARRVGDPKRARAVGAANGRNPIAIVVPCHRVIGKNGALTGFGGGMEAKRILLALEQGRADSRGVGDDGGVRAPPLVE
jgi:methylated-DNA-[protein]-cysteine S-methyltransferase